MPLIIEPSYDVLFAGPEPTNQFLEKIARTCYKSEDKITAISADKFVRMLRSRGHEAMLEFAWIAVRFVTSRGITHEIVRHRLFSFAQESTRYCDYGKAGQIGVIRPPEVDAYPSANEDEFWSSAAYWDLAVQITEECYNGMRANGLPPQIARDVLPTCAKTEIVVAGNLREWRHFFELRTGVPAHPHMRSLVIPLLQEMRGKMPIVFDDITVPDREVVPATKDEVAVLNKLLRAYVCGWPGDKGYLVAEDYIANTENLTVVQRGTSGDTLYRLPSLRYVIGPGSYEPAGLPWEFTSDLSLWSDHITL